MRAKRWWRKQPSKKPTTVADLVRRIDKLDDEATIYALEPWGPDSPAIVHVQDLEAGGELHVGDLKYLLEVDLARDAVEVCEEWRRAEGLETDDSDRVQAVIHYATHDAHMPVRPPPRLPSAVVDGLALQVLWFDRGDQGGSATLTAPDGTTAQIVWDSGPARFEHRAVHPAGGRSWGLYGVARPLPLTTDEEAAVFLRAIHDEALAAWRAWRGDVQPSTG